MASQSHRTSHDPTLIGDAKSLLWGHSLKNDVFSRWAQGFVFSDKESTALVQLEGGPCAVIAPVQAYIIKCGLFRDGSSNIDTFRSSSNEKANQFLVEALFEILSKLHSSSYVLVSLKHQSTLQQRDEEGEGSVTNNKTELISSKETKTRDQNYFHENLKYYHCNDLEELKLALNKSLPEFQSKFGVLLYLYSLVLSKGIQQIKNEVEDPTEPLIDGTYGHGSQSLINLLLTSQATSNVWDNEKDIAGLKLRGIQKQSAVGFLTLLEHMRYCEVGWFYKNPMFPVWVLGSETHLTVMFSMTEKLVVKDYSAVNAMQVFSQFDPEGNGFISSTLLEDVLKSLDLVAEKEYVDIMTEKMDSEGLGIITRNCFMEEFFPYEPSDCPSSFNIYHYNGLPQSCVNGTVLYAEGMAVLAEEVDIQFVTDTSPIKLCLQTKWPSLEITWLNSAPPSLN
ncbi:ubiquitin carboxyl-terminal hydrolase MINDY-3-like [Physella acuta]|uniref:ubiquitin carboxyl-terminal hydrolase MINDY-3-like n=1 Tax=Physella acuta TaxID=109671 RepID=UPI0027DE115A|nr:ubiquitin carboxyl-terminal hydrolase MINDY-3-like [Physella acuta]